MRKQKINILLAFFAITALLIQSCVKEEFTDVPEKTYITDISELYDVDSITSIAAFVEMYKGQSVAITDDIFLKGTVISDDSHGNIYKKISLQDSTGGIEIQIDGYDLYKSYPVGTYVYIKCKGLFYSEYRGTPQINFYSNGSAVRLPSKIMADYVIRAEGGKPVEPKVVKIGDLNASYINTLIRLDSVQFADTSLTYALDGSSENRSIISFEGSSIDLRTSGYADFYNEKVAQGNGSITAIFGVYDADFQLTVRSLDDINMTGNRFLQISEFFNSGTGSFTTVDVLGTATWENSAYNGENFAKISGYNAGANEDWLISPKTNISADFTEAAFNFTHTIGYSTSTLWTEDLTVWISTDYDGAGNPNDFTWTQVTDFEQASSETWWEWTNSGALDLSAYKGKDIYIGFRYKCTDSSAATWEINDVTITGR